MVAGLGSGLFLFDENGCPVNPLDEDDNRKGCEGNAPANNFNPARAAFNLDRIVDSAGVAQGSNNHALLQPGQGATLRMGSATPNLSGPLGSDLIQLLTDPIGGLVLDAWLDADGQLRGDAAKFVRTP